MELRFALTVEEVPIEYENDWGVHIDLVDQLQRKWILGLFQYGYVIWAPDDVKELTGDSKLSPHWTSDDHGWSAGQQYPKGAGHTQQFYLKLDGGYNLEIGWVEGQSLTPKWKANYTPNDGQHADMATKLALKSDPWTRNHHCKATTTLVRAASFTYT